LNLSFLARFTTVTVAGAIAAAIVLAYLLSQNHLNAIEGDVVAQAVGQASALMTQPLTKLDLAHHDARAALPGIISAANQITNFEEYARSVSVYWTDGTPIYPLKMAPAPAPVASAIQTQSFWRSAPFVVNGEHEFSVYTPLTGNDNRYVAVIRLDISSDQLASQNRAEGRFVVVTTLGTVALLALSLLTLAFFAQRELNKNQRIANETLLETMKGIAIIVDKRDPYTAGHSLRVAMYSTRLAAAMRLAPSMITTIEQAALLHDLGKVGIPDAVLLKPAALDNRERGIIGFHPDIAAEILGGVEAMRALVPCIVHHHERFDGKGYPRKIAGEAIPLGARVIAVADSYDAMTTDRPYRRALSVEFARAEIVRCAGTQFDERCAHVFVELIDAGNAVPPMPSSDPEALARSFGPRAGMPSAE
jgi:HD-GYP domain-containing protein (c-di-GMP phosphodiesterase class II)